MSRFVAIDLSGLTPPDIIEEIDFEVVLEEMTADLVARYPEIEGYIKLESEPSRKLLEAFAYREINLRARINDAVRAVMLASSNGNDLDGLAALYATERMMVDDGTGNLVQESDARFRRRIQLAPEAFSVAGPEGAYQYHALTQAPWARDVSAVSPKPGVVRVTILRAGADPKPETLELDDVRRYLSGPDIRPLTDMVEVSVPHVIRTPVNAELTLYPGPDAGVVLQRAQEALAAWLESNRMLGMNLRRSAIFAKLHQEGVHSVNLIEPAQDIVLDPTQVYSIDSTEISVVEIRDE